MGSLLAGLDICALWRWSGVRYLLGVDVLATFLLWPLAVFVVFSGVFVRDGLCIGRMVEWLLWLM